MRSCASKNSCGGVGCISDMALYGKGSLTQIVWSSAPTDFANSMAVSIAFAVISEPSVGTRMRLNMVVSLRIANCAKYCGIMRRQMFPRERFQRAG